MCRSRCLVLFLVLGLGVMGWLRTADSDADEFLLEVPGDPVTRSTAEWSPRGLSIVDARGQQFDYTRRPELDSADGRFLAYYSAEARRYLRWPADGNGPMVLGTQVPDGISWKRSLMQIRRVGRAPDPIDGPLVPGIDAGSMRSEVAAVAAPDGTVWTAQVDEDGTLDLYERRDGVWRHQDIQPNERLPAGTPLAMLYDERTDAPRIYAVDARGQIVEVNRSRLRRLTSQRGVQFPRLGYLASLELRGRQLLVAADVQGRIWSLDPSGGPLRGVEVRPELFEPGIPMALVAQRDTAELFVIDRGGRLLGYSFDHDGWSRPYHVANGLVSGGSLAAIYARTGGAPPSVHLASVDPRGRLHVWHDAAGILVDQLLPQGRFLPGSPVALAEIDGLLSVSAVSVDGRWMEWRRDPRTADAWSASLIADGFATGSSVVLVDSVAHGFAVDRTGRVIAGLRRPAGWECSLCSPGLAFAPQLARRAITPNEPLPAINVHFDNAHSEELVLRIHDIESGTAPVELHIAPGDSITQRIHRSAGAILEESYLAPGPTGELIENLHQVPLPPRGRYAVTVYANRQTSLYFDRTRNKGPIPDETNNSLVSLGLFVLPPGALLEDGAHIDIYREALARRNPGAVSLKD